MQGSSAIFARPKMKIDTLLTPAELPALARRDLRGTACVVFDILRATSTFVTALQNGAQAVVPVSEISEAVALKEKALDMLLAGERDGVKIRKWHRLPAGESPGTESENNTHAGSLCHESPVDFDFGNSPREFRAEKVRGKIIVSTTTNGTRALRACANAKIILASSFLNLAATAKYLNQAPPEEILLVCAGTGEGVALEDVLAAGALSGLVGGEFSDATEIASRAFLSAKNDLPAVIASSQNARRLLAIPELRADVAFCAQRDVFKSVAAMGADGTIRLVRNS
jgi:2-phosphosulfolactate phosphatase